MFWFLRKPVKSELNGIQGAFLGLVFNITFTLASWPAGRFSGPLLAFDNWPRQAIFRFRRIVFILCSHSRRSRLAIWLAMAFYGLFYALTNAVLKALIVESVRGRRPGACSGIYSFFTSVTTLLSSVKSPSTLEGVWRGVPFYVSAGIAGVSGVCIVSPRSPA